MNPYDEEKNIEAAINELANEDENFRNGVAFDQDFRLSVFGISTGLSMALSTEAGA